MKDQVPQLIVDGMTHFSMIAPFLQAQGYLGMTSFDSLASCMAPHSLSFSTIVFLIFGKGNSN